MFDITPYLISFTVITVVPLLIFYGHMKEIQSFLDAMSGRKRNGRFAQK